MITSIEIKNFKSIRSLSFDLPKFAVLVGPNGSGKTNIVQAMELFGEILARGTTDPAGELGWANILRRGKGPARGGITLGARVEHAVGAVGRTGKGGLIRSTGGKALVTLTARLTLDHRVDDGDVVVTGEELIAETEASRLTIAFNSSGWVVDPGTDPTLWQMFWHPDIEQEPQGRLSDPEHVRRRIQWRFVLPAGKADGTGLDGDGNRTSTVLRILNRVRFEIPCIQAIALNAQVDRIRLDASALRSDTQLREATSRLLGPSGEGLANAIDRLRGRGREPLAAFRHVLEALRRVYPRIEDVRAQQVQPGRMTLLFRERGIADDLGLANVSDGVLHALALLVMLEGGKPRPSPGPLAIEEPENAIHPWSVRAMMGRAQASSRQVLVTTHSETVVNAVLDPASLFIVENDERKGTTVTPAQQKERALGAILAETGQGLGDVWMDGTLGGVPIP